jgi:hypothetical protein
MREGQVILFQARDVRGRVRGIGWIGVSEGRLPNLEHAWEGIVDGVESVLVEWVRHADGVAITVDDVDSLERDNLGRRNYISNPIPIRRSKVLSRGFPSVFINLVFGRNTDSMAMQYLLYDPVNMRYG